MKTILKKPSAWLPIAMSLMALIFTLTWLAIFGVVHEEDEGIAAHIFQLLMGGQLPIILFFAVRWLLKKPKLAIQVLALQFIAGLIAFVPIFFLEL
jgi:mannose/fructose/N-acetylgalactosamine-specific phosphotransferase system component IID